MCNRAGVDGRGRSLLFEHRDRRRAADLDRRGGGTSVRECGAEGWRWSVPLARSRPSPLTPFGSLAFDPQWRNV